MAHIVICTKLLSLQKGPLKKGVMRHLLTHFFINLPPATSFNLAFLTPGKVTKYVFAAYYYVCVVALVMLILRYLQNE